MVGGRYHHLPDYVYLLLILLISDININFILIVNEHLQLHSEAEETRSGKRFCVS